MREPRSGKSLPRRNVSESLLMLLLLLLRAHGGGRTRWDAAGLRQGGEEACLCFVLLAAVSAELACPGHASRFQGGRRVFRATTPLCWLVAGRIKDRLETRDATAGVAGASHRVAAQFCGRGDASGPDSADVHAFSAGHGRALWRAVHLACTEHESSLLGTAANRSEVAGRKDEDEPTLAQC